MDKKEMLKKLREGQDPLEVSIQKWQDIVDGEGEDLGELNCALCKTFPRQDCRGCPIAEKTGKSGCDDTPYYADGPSEVIAVAMLEFLKSLRKNP